jgi:hypothetical protein
MLKPAVRIFRDVARAFKDMVAYIVIVAYKYYVAYVVYFKTT